MAVMDNPQTSTRVEIDVAHFHPLKPASVRHGLVGHPLLGKDSLLQLATRLKSPGKVNYISGQTTPDADFTELLGTHGTGRSLEETLERIEEPGSWVAFYHIESDPIYRELIDECLDTVQPAVRKHDPGMFGRMGWIFFSSPGALTPFHIDTETNLLLQIHGEKELSVWDPYDRTVLPERSIETYLATSSLKQVTYRPDLQEKAYAFRLTPGVGAYMPCTAPHLARTCDGDYSITLALTYFTAATERRSRVYRANSVLRKLRLSPRPYGDSPFADGVKSRLYSSYLSVKKLLIRPKDRG